MVAEAFTASDEGGAATKITEVGCGVSLRGGKLPRPPHPASTAIVPMATKKAIAFRPIMTGTPLSAETDSGRRRGSKLLRLRLGLHAGKRQKCRTAFEQAIVLGITLI
jgi:hypothetical protein